LYLSRQRRQHIPSRTESDTPSDSVYEQARVNWS
jgi:hypothetical protein